MAKMDMVRVLEPAPGTETKHIAIAIDFLRETWQLTEVENPSEEPK